MKTFRYDTVMADGLVGALNAAEADGWVLVSVLVHQYQVEGGTTLLGVIWFRIA